MNTDERSSKRVKFAESRGRKRQYEDVEELEANAEKQHLDVDVEMRSSQPSGQTMSQEMRQPQRRSGRRQGKHP